MDLVCRRVPGTQLDDVERQQWIIVGGLSTLGLVGVAWGVARGDPFLIGLWIVYLLLAAAFAYRAVQ